MMTLDKGKNITTHYLSESLNKPLKYGNFQSGIVFLSGVSCLLFRATIEIDDFITMSVDSIAIPVKTIGPIKIRGPEVNDEIIVPLATFETPMWPSTNRGASVSRHCEGIQCVILNDGMTRSVLVEGPDALTVKRVADDLLHRRQELQHVVRKTSSYCQLTDWHTQIIGNLLFLRLETTTGDASGHNMATKAADAILTWLINTYPALKYVSVSGNLCVDKKVSAINGILGRGKSVVADMLIPRAVCQERLKTTPEAIVNLNIKKNLVGSIA